MSDHKTGFTYELKDKYGCIYLCVPTLADQPVDNITDYLVNNSNTLKQNRLYTLTNPLSYSDFYLLYKVRNRIYISRPFSRYSWRVFWPKAKHSIIVHMSEHNTSNTLRYRLYSFLKPYKTPMKPQRSLHE